MRKAIAVFDIDGTVVTQTSAERIFARHLLARGELGIVNAARFLRQVVVALPHDWVTALSGNKSYLKGKSRRRLEQLAQECFEQRIAPRISETARRTLEEHRQCGLEIVLLSGTLDVLLRHFHEYLGADRSHGATLAVSGGVCTGQVSGIFPYGKAKAEIVRSCYGGSGYDLSASFAYADRMSDLEFLELFGHPAVVNARGGLIRRAKKKGIRTVCF